ncbi:MHYT domain-containing protein [Sphingomonas sp. BGYR3]|uniref:MHYT domain-containing protein n=1 Tax=Sphingomonas sp. BGYR3 TaxID=2975483 RepID=UPI0021A62327|nr:MHYT domain-containing protein [Sphingomonas sp. BGYR3]MDG5489875.1 MHYT domain-containing protein [Sphingomonas sp. BGYR3]
MTGIHDPALVPVSIGIAVLASFTALSIVARMRAASGRATYLWLCAAAVALGGGVWSMHFVAMLAYRMPGMVMRHDLALTLVSLVLAIGATGLGLGGMDWNRPRRLRVGLAGLFIGGGVAAMHYVGMSGMYMAGYSVVYDVRWVALSILIALAAATAAVWLASRDYGRGRQLGAAIVMGAAIAGMHYAAMAGVGFVPDADSAKRGVALFDQTALGLSISVVTAMILILALAAARVQRFIERAAQEQARTTLLLTIADTLRGQDSGEALSAIARALGEHFGAVRSGFAEWDASGGSFDFVVGWSDGSVPPLAGSDAARFVPSTLDTLSTGGLIASENLPLLQSITVAGRPDGGAADHAAFLIVPFVRHARLRSIVYLNDRSHRRWRADEIALIEDIAERIRLFIERQAAESELRALNASLELRIEARTAELRLAEDRRRQADALYRAYFENTPDRLFVIGVRSDGDFFVEQLNPAHQAIVGFALDELEGRTISEILSPDLAERVTSAYRHVVETRQLYQYREIYPETGDRRYLDTTLVPLFDAVGHVVRIIGSSRDVTRQVQTEEALQQAQKMEAMGQLTGGVAHDFNNLLTPMLGALDRLHRKGVGDDRDRRLIDGALQSAERARTLVHRLLSFARRQPLQPVPVDLSQLVTDMAGLITSTVGPRVNLILDTPSMLRPATADPNQLEMALLNLAVNARDAMPDGGTLTIGVSSAVVDPGDGSGLAPGAYLRLMVEDTGTGMDAETLSRAIEPFFTTKALGRGTGLGLSMAHGLASQLGGTLTIDSVPGRGTSICIWLPACGDLPVAKPVAGDPSTRRSSGQVLLVDDEDLVRGTTAQMLSDIGFDVTVAGSGDEALALLDGGYRPDLMITDHLMPGMTGNALARTCRERFGDLRILVVSGYADADGIDAGLPRLTKPFRQDELANAIGLLSGSPA